MKFKRNVINNNLSIQTTHVFLINMQNNILQTYDLPTPKYTIVRIIYTQINVKSPG